MCFIKKQYKIVPWFVILFGLFSCGAPSPWVLNYIKSGDSEFNSSRLTYRNADKNNGIELEFLKTEESLNLYLYVHSRSISCFHDNPKKAKVIMEGDGKNYVIIASRHEGGQRLLIPSSYQQIIIDLLHAGIPICLSIEGYNVSIDPVHFSEFFYKMHYPPQFSSPFHLPF